MKDTKKKQNQELHINNQPQTNKEYTQNKKKSIKTNMQQLTIILKEKKKRKRKWYKFNLRIGNVGQN